MVFISRDAFSETLREREVVRRFPTRDKILGSSFERLSGYIREAGYCFNVFESNIDASQARYGTRCDGTTHITSTGRNGTEVGPSNEEGVKVDEKGQGAERKMDKARDNAETS